MKGKLLRIGTIILGNVFVAFAVSTLVLENQLISGGVTGLGIVTNHYTGINISLIVGIINVLLFLLGLFFIGKKFADKVHFELSWLSTLISTFVFPVLLEFFNTNAIFHNYCQDTLLAVVLAGCLVGIGVGLMIRSDASSGGMDIIAIILNRKLGIPVFIMVNVFDFIILCMQATFSNPTKILYSIVLVFVTSFMLNKTLTKGSKMVQLVVISDCHEMIKKMIIEEADAGVTSLYSQKGFNETDTKTLLTIIPPVKLTKIKEQIKLIDPVAFMVVATVDEVSGRGYTLERHH